MPWWRRLTVFENLPKVRSFALPLWEEPLSSSITHVYVTHVLLLISFQSLAIMAAENDGQVVCPRTKEIFNLDDAEKVFVMWSGHVITSRGLVTWSDYMTKLHDAVLSDKIDDKQHRVWQATVANSHRRDPHHTLTSTQQKSQSVNSCRKKGDWIWKKALDFKCL